MTLLLLTDPQRVWPIRPMEPALGTIRQVAYVVEDLDSALEHWIGILNAGPFFVFEHAELSDQLYRGAASSIDVTLAVGNSGDVQIELILPEDRRLGHTHGRRET